MMVNTMKLKGKIVENGYTLADIATAINIDYSTLYRKFKRDGLTFTIGEVNKIVKVLKLSKNEAIEIFFDSGVA